jgi:hypothetical protein
MSLPARRGTHWAEFHERLHLVNGAYDLRTPVVVDGRVVGWQLRPDLLLKSCEIKGCRVRLYMDARGVPEIEAET